MNDFNLLAIMLRFPELSNDEANRLAQPHAWPYFANPNRRWVTFSGFIRLPLEPTGSR